MRVELPNFSKFLFSVWFTYETADLYITFFFVYYFLITYQLSAFRKGGTPFYSLSAPYNTLAEEYYTNKADRRNKLSN